MPLRKYLNRVERFDQLVREEHTGPPEEFARKIGLSKRAFHELRTELIEDFECPIAYSSERKTYYYTEKGRLRGIVFEKNK